MALIISAKNGVLHPTANGAPPAKTDSTTPNPDDLSTVTDAVARTTISAAASTGARVAKEQDRALMLTSMPPQPLPLDLLRIILDYAWTRPDFLLREARKAEAAGKFLSYLVMCTIRPKGPQTLFEAIELIVVRPAFQQDPDTYMRDQLKGSGLDLTGVSLDNCLDKLPEKKKNFHTFAIIFINDFLRNN